MKFGPPDNPVSIDVSLDLKLLESPRSPRLDLTTPDFLILVDDKPIGHIMRGHVMISGEFRGKGHFAEGLRGVEAYERKLFARGDFPNYQEAIKLGIGVGSEHLHGDIWGRTRPCHFDFWRLPDVAARYVHHGYALSPTSHSALCQYGYRGSERSPQLCEFLVAHHMELRKSGFIALLIKEVDSHL